MKILQVSPGYYPIIGGVEEHVRNISERLVGDHNVTVFTTDPSGRLPTEESINGVMVRRFHSFSPQNAYHISITMTRELRKANFDIVHGHNYHALPAFFSRYAESRRFLFTPHYHGHSSSMLRDYLLKLYKPIGKKIFSEADGIIAVSNYEKSLLISDFKMSEEEITVIPNGVDMSEFSDLKKAAKGHKTLLYVGRLEEYKGVQFIIRALPALSEDVRLEVVGSGPYKAALLQLIDELGLAGKVNFYQDLSRRELLERYAAADLFLLLSRYEAFGITVAEALAAKTPCIVANTSALSEWVNGQSCLGIDYPIDIDELTRSIEKAMGQTVGNVKPWDWDEVVTSLLKIYES